MILLRVKKIDEFRSTWDSSSEETKREFIKQKFYWCK